MSDKLIVIPEKLRGKVTFVVAKLSDGAAMSFGISSVLNTVGAEAVLEKIEQQQSRKHKKCIQGSLCASVEKGDACDRGSSCLGIHVTAAGYESRRSWVPGAQRGAMATDNGATLPTAGELFSGRSTSTMAVPSRPSTPVASPRSLDVTPLALTPPPSDPKSPGTWTHSPYAFPEDIVTETAELSQSPAEPVAVLARWQSKMLRPPYSKSRRALSSTEPFLIPSGRTLASSPGLSSLPSTPSSPVSQPSPFATLELSPYLVPHRLGLEAAELSPSPVEPCGAQMPWQNKMFRPLPPAPVGSMCLCTNERKSRKPKVSTVDADEKQAARPAPLCCRTWVYVLRD
eukprot:NODE_1234_length_1624_cov_19.021587_g1099_i0.p1 GENE.NODE_1234_length_1624_cov_19.021587_g1099_i0~~NODE_1234_length_1624_cov_19.021587_g1099_i0.p1  ORF type:complete len:377 (-),score=62.78 NODE_1234_length_1624_cov_19.021587_g1099_i0:493-1521(-)